MKNFTAVISSLERNTEDSLTVELRLPQKLAFKSGQHITLGAPIGAGGREVYRTYSVCEPAIGGMTGRVRLGVRVLKHGTFSSWLEKRKVGEVVTASPPGGLFYLRPPVSPVQENLFLAAGSGITPILSMVEDFLMNYPQTRAVLLYGNQSLQKTMFLEKLLQLKNQYLSRLELCFFTSRENQEVGWRHARLDEKTLGDLVEKKVIRPSVIREVYLCGPGDMMEVCQKFLEAKGVSPQSIYREQFTPAADGGKRKPLKKSLQKTAKTLAEVTAVLQGLERRFEFKEGDQSLLEAAQRSGLNTPYACAGGMCGTCRAKILQGKVRMEKNYALDEEELRKNFILTCQARPVGGKSPKLKISFDY